MEVNDKATEIRAHSPAHNVKIRIVSPNGTNRAELVQMAAAELERATRRVSRQDSLPDAAPR